MGRISDGLATTAEAAGILFAVTFPMSLAVPLVGIPMIFIYKSTNTETARHKQEAVSLFAKRIADGLPDQVSGDSQSLNHQWLEQNVKSNNTWGGLPYAALPNGAQLVMAQYPNRAFYISQQAVKAAADADLALRDPDHDAIVENDGTGQIIGDERAVDFDQTGRITRVKDLTGQCPDITDPSPRTIERTLDSLC